MLEQYDVSKFSLSSSRFVLPLRTHTKSNNKQISVNSDVLLFVENCHAEDISC